MSDKKYKLIMYKGKYIEQLSRKELINALNNLYSDLNTSKKQHLKDLEILIGDNNET